MASDRHFWTTTLVRGLLALSVGAAVVVLPDLAATILLLPFALVLSVMALSVYGLFDSAIVLIESFMLDQRAIRMALRIQGVAGLVIAIALISSLADHVLLSWFLFLISMQALSVAATEITLARRMRFIPNLRWNFFVGFLAGGCSIVYLVIAIGFADRIPPRDVSFLLYTYLVALGLALCITAARMLYSDHEFKTLSEPETVAGKVMVSHP